MIFPTLDQVKTLAKTANVIPVCSTILADTETPVSVWLKMFEKEPYGFLLESVSGEDTVARYSFLGGNPFMTFRVNGQSWEMTGRKAEKGAGDPVSRLREVLAGFRPARVDKLPRFSGGAVGFFSYDAIRLWEKIPDRNAEQPVVDDVFLGFYKDLVVFDKREHRILLICNILVDDTTDIETAYKDACYHVGKLEDRMAVRLNAAHVDIKQTGSPVSTVSRAQYETAVEKCKEYIRAGDIFQVVLSQRFSVKVEANPFDLYRILRTVNPSPYMYYLSINEASIIGASPEMLVRVENRVTETRPIAGTIRRGSDDVEDERLATQLRADPKERAEHIMLVDLGRNDLGRVCEYGSVRPEEIMHIEKYSHVMHLVTNVRGMLREDKDALDALFSCFPAGTLSGAPKIRAMEIIDELEHVRRGIYGGALGYFDFSGNMDSCIVIRTIFFKDGVAYVQAGAGIVADSVPAKEYDESVNKAMALFTALDRAQSDLGR